MSNECPSCAETVRADDLFCMFCGAPLRDDAGRLQTQAERYEKMERWPQAIEARLSLADRITDPEERGRQFYAAGVLQQERLQDTIAAARSFDKALDADPTRLKAFESLDQLLVDTGDVVEQARSYRRMIRRALDAEAEERVIVALARNLADICQTRLKQPQEALDALRLILDRRPADLAALTQAAELYDQIGDVNHAAEMHRRILEIDPRRVESYQSLRRLFLNTERYDAGWCVCRVLSVLGQANADEVSFYERYATTTPTRAERPLQQGHWPLIDHPLKSPLLDELLARTHDALLTLMGRQHKMMGIKRRRDAIDLADMTRFANVMGYLFEFLPVPPADLFRSADVVGMQPALLEPPAILVGSDLLEEDLYALAFVGARQLVRSRPAHLMGAVQTRAAERRPFLEQVLATLRATFHFKSRALEHDAKVREALQRNLPPREVQALTELVERMNDDAAVHWDAERYIKGIDLTADRAGLIFANDLEKALAIIRSEPPANTAASVGERATELIRYAYSEEYFQVRRLIGHNID